MDPSLRQCVKSSLKLIISTCSTSSASAIPSYNYGLSGQGKSKRSTVKKLPPVKGEVLFGLHPVLLALKTQKRKSVYNLFVDEKFEKEGDNHKIKAQILEQALLCKTPIHIVKPDILNQISGNRPHQGACMDVSGLKATLWSEQDLLTWTSHLPFWLLLHNVQDPMNFGAVLRSAYYLGIDRVIFPGSRSCKLSPVVSKASAGAMEVIDLLTIPVTSSEILFCNWWRHQGGEVVGTGSGSDGRTISLNNFHMSKPTLLILGNEGYGLEKDLEISSDTVITIPGCNSNIDSLNVSVAAGILMHWIKNSRNLEKSLKLHTD
ncbi:Ribose methyltransferase [Bulinus truncatus]|nr:Ribose methyltransferase [Bulinus truncatus]